jgi:hypothetical protein
LKKRLTNVINIALVTLKRAPIAESTNFQRIAPNTACNANQQERTNEVNGG